MPITDAEKLYKVPGRALNFSCRLQLSQFLNRDQVLRSPAGFARDVQGLAEQMGFKSIEVQNFLKSENPTLKVLETWEKQREATFGQLLTFLKRMGRHDIVQDIYSLLEKDAQAFLNREQEISVQISKNLQDVSATSCPPPDFRVQHDFEALTCDDTRTGECTLYDAYLCYAEENENFAFELASQLESKPFCYKLYIEKRDSLGGQNVHVTSIELIKERCRHMLVILSPEFLNSSACTFQTEFAASMAVEKMMRIIIPIILSPCKMPSLLQYVSKIDFTKTDHPEWAWKKLIKSLRVQPQKYSSSISSNERKASSNTLIKSIETPSQNSSIPCIEFPPTLNMSTHLKPSTISSSSFEVSDVVNDSESENSKSSTFQKWQNFFKSKDKPSKKFPLLKKHFPLNNISSSSNVTSGFYSLSSRDLESVEESVKCCTIDTSP